MDVDQVISRISAMGVQAEVIYVRTRMTEFSWEKGSQHGMSYTETGYGLRVVKGSRQGFAYGPRLDEGLIDRALKAADAMGPDPYNSLPAPEGPIEQLPGAFDPSLEEPHELLRGYLDVLLAEASDQVNVIMARSWGGWAEVTVRNTEGVDASQRSSYCGVVISGNIVEGDYVGPEISEYVDARSPKGLMPEVAVRRLVEKANMTRNRRRAQLSGRPIVLTPKAVNSLLFPLLNHAVSLENIFRGRSPIKPGDQLGSNITIYDDPRLPDAPWSRAFDGEGLSTKRITIVRDGLFHTPLSNTYWARRAGSVNTHSSWRTFMTLPAISATYLVFEAPSVKDLGDAVIVDDVQGVHTSNFDTGEFSVTASVAWDSDGGLREFVISGDLRSLLAGVLGALPAPERYGRVVTGSLLVSGLRVSS